MSAVAPAVAVQTPAYFQAPLDPSTNEALPELVHDLRQPLSSIEAIAYYLEMTLPPGLLQARQHMRRIQELVAEADSVLHGAASTIRTPPASAAAAGAS